MPIDRDTYRYPYYLLFSSIFFSLRSYGDIVKAKTLIIMPAGTIIYHTPKANAADLLA
jgi:hypothetical protein